MESALRDWSSFWSQFNPRWGWNDLPRLMVHPTQSKCFVQGDVTEPEAVFSIFHTHRSSAALHKILPDIPGGQTKWPEVKRKNAQEKVKETYGKTFTRVTRHGLLNNYDEYFQENRGQDEKFQQRTGIYKYNWTGTLKYKMQ